MTKFFIFNNVDTGQTWAVKAETVEEAKETLPQDADWDDWFEV